MKEKELKVGWKGGRKGGRLGRKVSGEGARKAGKEGDNKLALKQGCNMYEDHDVRVMLLSLC